MPRKAVLCTLKAAQACHSPVTGNSEGRLPLSLIFASKNYSFGSSFEDSLLQRLKKRM
jgi:hypothetical protein